MGRKSKVDKIPAETREFLNELLRDPANSQRAMSEKVNRQLIALGLEPVMTERAVNSYAARMNKIGSKIMRTREVAHVFMSKIGNKESGDVGKLTSEMLTAAVCELSAYLAEKDIDEKCDEHKLAKTLKDLAQAAKLAQESGEVVDKRIEKAVRKAQLETAEAIEKECAKKGLSSEAVKTFRAGLGFEDGQDIIDI
jgi:hypothetical protein